jgi:hypothetical protein
MVVAAAVAACGEDKLSAARVPLAPMAYVAAQSYECPVVPEHCFRYLLVVSRSRSTSLQLRAAETALLRREGWRLRAGVTGRQLAADSPDRSLFVSFATGADELADERARQLLWSERLARQLSGYVTAGRPVVTMTLESRR